MLFLPMLAAIGIQHLFNIGDSITLIIIVLYIIEFVILGTIIGEMS